MNESKEKNPLRGNIMDAIHKGSIHMRPRWHFIALSAFALVGIALVILTLLYVASLTVFFMRDTGAWFVPAFGASGWFAFMRSIPWLLVLLVAAFIALLEILVQRFSFVYQKPLIASVLGLILFVAVGGLLIGSSSFHRDLFKHARHHELPFPLAMVYQAPFRSPHGGDVYHGSIVSTSSSGFVIVDVDDEGTSTIILTPQTRLPYGADFSIGDMVVVFGNHVGTDTVHAFGVREVGE